MGMGYSAVKMGCTVQYHSHTKVNSVIGRTIDDNDEQTHKRTITHAVFPF